MEVGVVVAAAVVVAASVGVDSANDSDGVGERNPTAPGVAAAATGSADRGSDDDDDDEEEFSCLTIGFATTPDGGRVRIPLR